MEPLRTKRVSFLLLAVFLAIGIGVVVAFGGNYTNKTEKKETMNDIRKEQGESIIYGVWGNNKSLVKAVNIESEIGYTLAELPGNIKRISILSPEKLLYIDHTNENDHGQNISVYSVPNKTTTSITTSSNDFLIDEYSISPNKRFLAIWEVALNKETNVLIGGKSRVYSLDINNPGVKNLIYDEVIDKPIHYPRGINNNGEIVFDTFLPNTETGWGNGMSRSDFKGVNKEEIKSLENGTYGTQPSLSPAGDKLIFAGYNGLFGKGETSKEGFKQAALTPNTLEIYDLGKNARLKIFDLSTNGIYTGVGWDRYSGNIVFSTISKDKSKEGLFLYNLASKSLKKIKNIEDREGNAFLTTLSSGDFLFSRKSTSEGFNANLGDSYSTLDTEYFIKQRNGLDKALKSSDLFMQFIQVAPSNYFASLKDIDVSVQEIESKADPRNSLQLQTFFLKTELPKKRIEKQTLPRCIDLSTQQCKAMGYNSDLTGDPNNLHDCIVKQRLANYKEKGEDGKRICMDSPLYLYGDNGKNVNIKINTPIFDANPSSNGLFKATLGSSGNFFIKGIKYQKIDFSYTPASSFRIPDYGDIVSKDKLEEKLREYSIKLGLNKIETDDLVEFGKKKISSPFVFISFFSQQKSKKILPIYFQPKPDNYINYVFYFKQLSEVPDIKPKKPDFKKSARRGFTAVEISEIVE